MPAHPIDFVLQAHVFSTHELMAIFDEKARFQRWLDFEAALAETQGELDIIPQKAAANIKEKADISLLDLGKIKSGYSKSRNSLIPILAALRETCDKDHGEFVHFGATTQDTLDTGAILELKDTFALISRDLGKLTEVLVDLARLHRDTPMAGRTHSQQALPITFGLKVALWLTEVMRHNDRLQSLQSRVLIGQLSGAVGTQAALGDNAFEVGKRTLEKLGLHHSIAPWHTSRDNMAEVSCFFALLTGTLAKICNEIFQLGKTEIAELREPPASGKAMSSSTMPHKRNPVLCERVTVLNTHVRSLHSVVMESMLHENERDPRALWSEWLAMPQISIYTGTALGYTLKVIGGLEVFPEQMLKNLHLHKDSIASEWLLFQLAKKLGKMNAQEELSRIIKDADLKGKSIKETLLADKSIGAVAQKMDLSMLDTPEKYTGQAGNMVDRILAEVTAPGR